MASSDASSSVEVAATPATVYALVTDLGVLTELADETAQMRWTKGTSARPGAVFRGTNRNGWRRWTTTCTVTAADEGRRFAFKVTYAFVPLARWEYDIEATETGCRVTESTTDMRPPGLDIFSGVVTGTGDRASANAAHIEATLRRLKERAEAQNVA